MIELVRLLLGRWLLLALLAFGVVVMHHAPLMDVQDSALAVTPPAATASHLAHADQVMPAGGDGGERGIHGLLVSAGGGSDVGTGHGFLHLCLAILAAAAGGLLAVLLSRARVVLQWPSTWSPFEACAGWFPPPLPVPRRLAVLCVLRL